MREIKFRAWWDNGTGDDEAEMFFVGDHTGTRHPLDCCVYAIEGQPVTLLQFTGLHDKNGKEIYEGDVVRIKGVIRTIVFDYGCFNAVNDYTDDPLGGFNEYDIDIIGNVYENPDLLKSSTLTEKK